MLSLSVPAVSTVWGLNNVPVAEQGGSWQAFLVSQLEEVLASWKGADVPDVGGEGVDRQAPCAHCRKGAKRRAPWQCPLPCTLHRRRTARRIVVLSGW
jgi:hypothetical protein